jgi:hypothetical protein
MNETAKQSCHRKNQKAKCVFLKDNNIDKLLRTVIKKRRETQVEAI